MMKKTVLFLLIAVMVFQVVPFEAETGYLLTHSDITAYINHHPIPSYACGGKTVICAEDLRFYGFDVNFSEKDMTLYITRNAEVFVEGIDFSKVRYPNGFPVGLGSPSSVKVVIGGHAVKSFAFKGTSMIAVEDLGFLGSFYWVSNQRAVKLWVDGIHIPDYKPVGYTNQVTGSAGPMIALTFDDGPGKFTDSILDVLSKNDARATFFALGCNAVKYPEALKRADALGMEIGNHTYGHSNLCGVSVPDGILQISSTDDKIKAITGKKPGFLRPPGGNYNDTVCSYAGKPVIMWSVDTLDWKVRNADAVVKSIMTAKDGDIVLMHDIYQSTADAVKIAVPKLIEKGYKLVTVSELAYYKGQKLLPGRVINRIK